MNPPAGTTNGMAAANQSRCWGCGEPAPGGVCMRPHPRIDYLAARHLEHIVDLDGIAALYTPTDERVRNGRDR